MENSARKPKFPPKDYSFFSFVFSILGWGLLESWLIAMHVSAVPHVVFTICALCLAGVSIHRYRLHRQLFDTAYSGSQQQGRHSRIGDVVWVLFLLGVGSVLGTLVLAGWALLLGAAVVGTIFLPLPWASFYRRHFAVSCAAVLIGTVSVLALGRHELSFFTLPIASWVFYTCASLALILTTRKSARPARAGVLDTLQAVEESSAPQ